MSYLHVSLAYHLRHCLNYWTWLASSLAIACFAGITVDAALTYVHACTNTHDMMCFISRIVTNVAKNSYRCGLYRMICMLP